MSSLGSPDLRPAIASLEHSTRPSYNASTRITVLTLGVLIGISSINHGLLECLQGNRPTPGHLVKALGSGYRWTVWTQGSEPAFTLVPNFLLTGILASVAGLLLIFWSIRFVDRPHGPSIFLLVAVTSFLVGGGLAQVALFTLNWAAATRIRASLGFWRWLIPPAACRVLGRFWRWPLVCGTVLFLTAIEIAVVGYIPGVSSRIRILHLLWGLAYFLLICWPLAFLCGFAHDIEARSPLRSEHV